MEDWAKVEIHATVAGPGMLDVMAGGFLDSFEVADENFNPLDLSLPLFTGAVDETTSFPLIFYVRPKAGMALNGDSLDIMTNYSDDMGTLWLDDSVRVTVGELTKTVSFELVDEEPDSDPDITRRDASGLNIETVEIRLNGVLLPLNRFEIIDVFEGTEIIGKRFTVILQSFELVTGANTLTVSGKDMAGNEIDPDNGTIEFQYP